MLKGLEISEIKYSYVRKNGEVFRFDSNYFLKKFIDDESLIRTGRYSTIKEIGAGLKSFGAYSLNNDVHYLESGVPFIRGVNMKKGRISFNDMIFIDETANSLLWKSEVKPEMVLLSMSGTIGDVAIASKKWKYPINSNQDIAKIETLGKINPYFLYAFLASKFGQNYLIREARGSVQQHVFLSQMEQFEIPLFNEKFVQSIQSTIEKSDEFQYLAEDLYKNAETILLETIGLKDFEPSTDGVNVKSFKESFLTSGRLDAEYYQKKYEDIESKILGYKNGADILKNQIEYISTGEYTSSYESIGLESVPYIRNNNMKKGHIELDDEYYVNPNNFKTKANIGEILTSRVGTIGLFGVIKAGQENCVYSDNILCFKLKGNYIPEVYAMLFSTELYKLLLEKLAGGSVQPLITQTSIKGLPIPNVEYSIQLKVADLINESFRLKKQSEQLLETAKRAVEIAIEQDEDAAMRYIEEQSN